MEPDFDVDFDEFAVLSEKEAAEAAKLGLMCGCRLCRDCRRTEEGEIGYFCDYYLGKNADNTLCGDCLDGRCNKK